MTSIAKSESSPSPACLESSPSPNVWDSSPSPTRSGLESDSSLSPRTQVPISAQTYCTVLPIYHRLIILLLIGTFVPENKSDEVVYGLTHQLESWNPIYAQVDLIKHKSTQLESHLNIKVLDSPVYSWYLNPFATDDAYMRQLFHCLQWYAGSERVKDENYCVYSVWLWWFMEVSILKTSLETPVNVPWRSLSSGPLWMFHGSLCLLDFCLGSLSLALVSLSCCWYFIFFVVGCIVHF